MLRRWVKWIPQPDSLAFHHRPESEPGLLKGTRTSTGKDRIDTVPSPTWPYWLYPQHFTPPPMVSAQTCSSPAETAAIPTGRPTTSRGLTNGNPAHLTPPLVVSA